MSLPATDNFNRADGAPGSNWTTQQNVGAIVSNGYRPASGGASYEFWNADAFPDDQYSQAVLGSNGASSQQYTGVTVRASGTGGSMNAYLLQVNGTDAHIIKTIAGTPTILQTITGEGASAGDTYKITVEGNTLKAYKNGVQIGTDQASGGELTSGSAGIEGLQGDPITRLDDWEGGAVGGGGGGGNHVAKLMMAYHGG